MKKTLLLITSLICAFTSTAQCWKFISAGGNQVLVIDGNDKIWGWGSNMFGTLGLGSTTGDQLNPAQSANISAFTKIGVGGNEFAIALKWDGTLWSAGINDYGQLGIGNNVNKSSFTQIGLATDWQTFSTGGLHTLALKNGGTLWSWGGNSEGQLGNNTTVVATSPIQIGTATNWAMISAGGYYYSTAIKTDGTLWTWGNDSYQQLGNGSVLSNQLIPTQIGTDANWKTVSAGQYHTLAIKTDGSLWAWGSNSLGALGDGTTTEKLAPVRVGLATNWDKIMASNFTSYAIKTDGTLWSWGYNSNGQLGDGTIVDKLVPTQIGTAMNWKEISSQGSYYAVALKTDGSAWSWGINNSGTLGDGTRTQRLVPTAITCAALGQEEFEKSSISIYPNPSNGNFNVNTNESIKSVRAFDVLGKEVIVNSISNNQFFIEKKGLYFSTIELESGASITTKIIIN